MYVKITIQYLHKYFTSDICRLKFINVTSFCNMYSLNLECLTAYKNVYFKIEFDKY